MYVCPRKTYDEVKCPRLGRRSEITAGSNLVVRVELNEFIIVSNYKVMVTTNKSLAKRIDLQGASRRSRAPR